MLMLFAPKHSADCLLHRLIIAPVRPCDSQTGRHRLRRLLYRVELIWVFFPIQFRHRIGLGIPHLSAPGS